MGYEGEGTFLLGDENGVGSVTGIGLYIAEQQGATGVFRGWSRHPVLTNGQNRFPLQGLLTNNGRVIADGYCDADKVLDLSGFRQSGDGIANTVDNPTDGTTGWYAVRRGKLLLPSVAIDAGTGTYDWGEAPRTYWDGQQLVTEDEIDLVNSLQMTLESGSSGTMSIALLAGDRADGPLNSITSKGYIFTGVWEFQPVPFTTADVTIRYDHADAQILRFNDRPCIGDLDETDLLVLTATQQGGVSSAWSLVGRVGALTAGTHQIQIPNMTFTSGAVTYLALLQQYPADITLDGAVNVFDLQRLAQSWNKQLGDAGYDPWCDLTGDNKVNVFDLQVMACTWNSNITNPGSCPAQPAPLPEPEGMQAMAGGAGDGLDSEGALDPENTNWYDAPDMMGLLGEWLEFQVAQGE